MGSNYLPLFICLEGLKCLVVGGGAVALRKVQTLRDFNADIEVVSPEVVFELDELRERKAIQIKRKRFSTEDLDGVKLVIVSSNDREVNETVAKEAAHRGILCNVVDQPELCNAIFPSIYRRGRLQIAVSTGGASPAMARFIKENLYRLFGEEYELALNILWRLRKLTAKKRPPCRGRRNENLFNRIVGTELVALCKAKDFSKIKEMISQSAGQDVAGRLMDRILEEERKKQR